MALNRTRIDKLLSRYLNKNRKDTRLLFAQKRVEVDGEIVTDNDLIIDRFSLVKFDGETIQQNTPYYIMLNKPAGVVSATVDEQHITVIDLIKTSQLLSNDVCDTLHIVGRLDLNTTGLVLLTNDSRWSSHLTAPTSKVIKQYKVTLSHPITADYITAFKEGMFFSYENITTAPADLTIVAEKEAIVSLTEGRYHQIKRMFGRFQNKVCKLHRFSIGSLVLDNELPVGQCRLLTADEIKLT